MKVTCIYGACHGKIVEIPDTYRDGEIVNVVKDYDLPDLVHLGSTAITEVVEIQQYILRVICRPMGPATARLYPVATAAAATMKPLFIPLKTEYFNSFVAGTKDYEIRKYGPRWNEKTCAEGRPVTLSKGYGKGHRLSGKVGRFAKMRFGNLNEEAYRAARAVYGDYDGPLSLIWIEVKNAGQKD